MFFLACLHFVCRDEINSDDGCSTDSSIIKPRTKPQSLEQRVCEPHTHTHSHTLTVWEWETKFCISVAVQFLKVKPQKV